MKDDLRTQATNLLKEAEEKTIKAQELLKQAGDKHSLYSLQNQIADKLDSDRPPVGSTLEDDIWIIGKRILGETRKQRAIKNLKSSIKKALLKTEKEEDIDKKVAIISSYLLSLKKNSNWATQIDCDTCGSEHRMEVSFTTEWVNHDCNIKNVEDCKLGSHMDLVIVQDYTNCSLWERIKWALRDARNIILNKEGWHDICLESYVGSDAYKSLKDLLNIL